MSVQPTNEIFLELSRIGLIAVEPAPRQLEPGNADRLESRSRTSWVVSTPAGETAKLIIGRNLANLRARHLALAGACPQIIPAPLAFTHLDGVDALFEAYFEGTDLERALKSHPLPADVIRQGVKTVLGSLGATEQASHEAARSEEWRQWAERLCSLPAWEPADVVILADKLLPRLYQQITTAPPVTRWSNGDFLPSNILLNANGESRLVDVEFASRTHFFPEDAVRFRSLSAIPHDHRALFDGLVPERELGWHLYFWLRQFGMEIENNTTAYLGRFRDWRLGLIRRLAELVLEIPMSGWSTPTLQVDHALEIARWLPGARGRTRLAGWCHVPSASRLRAIVALQDGKVRATDQPRERPDVTEHFHGKKQASYSGFDLAINQSSMASPLLVCAVIDNGILIPFCRTNPSDHARGPLQWDGYGEWAARNDPDPVLPSSCPADDGPLFSLILPVFRTPEAFLRECLDSVLAQHYSKWELCLVDDGSAQPTLTAALEHHAKDPRIKVQIRRENGGISRATNDAIAMASGEFLVFLDHDDLLRPHALAEFAAELGRHPTLDALYSDEDKMSATGERIIPFFKPDFSPEYLLGVMYVGHALCVRTGIARAAGGFDSHFDGVQDYEFFLRVTRVTRRIGHVPRILYHWRQSPSSSALEGNIKGDMDRKQLEAVEAHLQALGDQRLAKPLGRHRVRLESRTSPTTELVRLASGALPLDGLRCAAARCAAEVMVLLPAESPKCDPDWLNDLACLASRPDSGCVAPTLISREGLVYESGLAVGPAGLSPLLRGFDPAGDGCHGSLRCNREVDAVSPHCVALRRELLMDETVPVTGDWFAFCSQLRARGLFHRVCASAQVVIDSPWRELPAFTASAGEGGYYNRHFDSTRGDYSLIQPDSPAPPAPESDRSLRWHIDQPVEGNFSSPCIIVRGWCFAAVGNAIRAVRLTAGKVTLHGVTGLPRPDVKAALPEAPDDNTGFEIRGTLPAGRSSLRIEAQLADGSWRELLSRTVEIERRILPPWLGGGEWMELMFFQMPAHMAHPPRPVQPETFPRRTRITGPRFSIVTPSYNHARFLPQTIESVLVQPGVTCEYVVQDGGSTDGSDRIIKKHAPKLHAWTSERDGGQVDAIAKGFAKMSGKPDDLMAWINSDDYYLSGTLGYVADYFAQHPDVDVIYGHRIVVNEESQEIGRWFLPQHDPAVLRLNDFVPQETLFWRRRVWDQVGGIDPSLHFAMDWDLLLRFQAAGARIVRVPRFLACFRVHAGQKTSAQMHDVGQKEITRLRERTFGRPFPPEELERNPRLLRYLRRSAFIEFLWKLGIRAP